MTKKTSVQCEKFDYAIGRLANIYYSYVLPGLISAGFNIISKGKGNVFIHFQFEITLENQILWLLSIIGRQILNHPRLITYHKSTFQT